jgi:hypothetical protein
VSIFPPPAQSADRGRPGGDAILSAVLDDIRATLRMSWVDPGIRSVTAQPEFFAAAWSATRPNVTRSFGAGAQRLRGLAEEAVPELLSNDHPARLEGRLSPVERDRLVRMVQALRAATPKVLMVLQAWAVLARRRRIAGTGREESPARRGIPTWQDTLGLLPRSLSPEAESILEGLRARLAVSSVPSSLLALAPWPSILEQAGRDAQRAARTRSWRDSVGALRRAAVDSLGWLPHPMELQWDVLARRGLTEDRREALADHLTSLAAAMPTDILVAHLLWRALGSPDGPNES